MMLVKTEDLETEGEDEDAAAVWREGGKNYRMKLYRKINNCIVSWAVLLLLLLQPRHCWGLIHTHMRVCMHKGEKPCNWVLTFKSWFSARTYPQIIVDISREKEEKKHTKENMNSLLCFLLNQSSNIKRRNLTRY